MGKSMKSPVFVVVIFCIFLFSVTGSAQEYLTSIGLGGGGGITVLPGVKEIVFTGRISAVLDRFTEAYDRISRLQWDLGMWQADEIADEWYGESNTKRSIYHLSMSTNYLFGGETHHFILGFGASLLWIQEDQTQYVADDMIDFWDAEEITVSYISAGFFPVLGVAFTLTHFLDFALESRFHLLLHPVSASAFTVTGSFYFILP